MYVGCCSDAELRELQMLVEARLECTGGERGVREMPLPVAEVKPEPKPKPKENPEPKPEPESKPVAKRAWSKAEVRRLTEMAAAGAKAKDIAAELGRAEDLVKRQMWKVTHAGTDSETEGTEGPAETVGTRGDKSAPERERASCTSRTKGRDSQMFQDKFLRNSY